MAVIGIDLGTTNSLVCVFRNGKAELIPNKLGNILTPSCIGFADDRETILVGQAAKDRLITHPELTAASFKRSNHGRGQTPRKHCMHAASVI